MNESMKQSMFSEIELMNPPTISDKFFAYYFVEYLDEYLNEDEIEDYLGKMDEDDGSVVDAMFNIGFDEAYNLIMKAIYDMELSEEELEQLKEDFNNQLSELLTLAKRS